MPPAFLAVWTEPGNSIELDDFQDWYDHEHIPLRLNHLPSFLTATRYHASDGLSPAWLALYDIQDMSTFSDEKYTSLRSNRSSREADLLKRLHTLDRRIFEVTHDTGESDLTSSLRCGSPTSVLITHGIEGDSFDSDRWQDDVIPLLKDAKGWVRTRVFHCVDHLKTGTSVSDSPNEQVVSPYLVVHELLGQDSVEIFNCVFTKTELGDVTREYRQWRLYCAYPSLTQLGIISVQ